MLKISPHLDLRSEKKLAQALKLYLNEKNLAPDVINERIKNLFSSAHISKLQELLIDSFFIVHDYQMTIDLCRYLLKNKNDRTFNVFDNYFNSHLLYKFSQYTFYHLHNLLIMALFKIGNVKKAEETAEHVLFGNSTPKKYRVNHAAILANYLFILESQGQHEKARECTQVALLANNNGAARFISFSLSYYPNRTTKPKTFFCATLQENQDLPQFENRQSPIQDSAENEKSSPGFSG